MTVDLEHAARLARQGRHGDALLMLDELGGRTSDDPVLLDLLARVHAQQGELAEADECWARALEVGGSVPAADSGRRRVAAVQARRYRPLRRKAAGAAAVVVVLAGAGLAGAYLARQDDPLPQPQTDPTLLSELRDTRQAQEDLSRQLGGVRGELDAIRANAKVIDDLSTALAASGLMITRQGDVLTVVFPTGLFASGTTLTDAGRQALADLAKHLGRELTITVVGHTDNGRIAPRGRYADHVDLGLARARAAAAELSTRAGLPLTAFAMTTTGMAEPPFPNTTTQDRARNRTVTLRLSLG